MDGVCQSEIYQKASRSENLSQTEAEKRADRALNIAVGRSNWRQFGLRGMGLDPGTPGALERFERKAKQKDAQS